MSHKHVGIGLKVDVSQDLTSLILGTQVVKAPRSRDSSAEDASQLQDVLLRLLQEPEARI